jgi:dGTP triphosphohydrolase
LHRTVCDYIAGMTDRYLLEEFARIAERGTGILPVS